MRTFTSSKNIFLACSLIVIAALSRLVPHPDNITPLGAMALLGGAYLQRKHLAFILPIFALLISDIVLNNTIYRAFYPEATGFIFFTKYMIWTYIAFIGIVGIGIVFLKKLNPGRLFLVSLSASSIFFLLSNFGSWLQSPIYTKDITGLVSCYAAGLPFFRANLFGDLVFVFVLFGVYHLIQQYSARRIFA